MALTEIGVDIDGFRLPARVALRSASQLGFRPVQLSAVSRDVSPEALTGTGRRHLKVYSSGLGLRIAALGADMGGRRFADPAAVDERVHRTMRIMDMAADMRVPAIATRIGCLYDNDSRRHALITDALEALAEYADRTGVVLAIETAETSPAVLRTLLHQIDCPSVRVAYDPAALLMGGDDPVCGVEPLADVLAHAFARDAVEGRPDHPGAEVRLGEGHVDLAEYFAALDDAGYGGPSIIRCLSTQKPVDEIAAAKRRLDEVLAVSA